LGFFSRKGAKKFIGKYHNFLIKTAKTQRGLLRNILSYFFIDI